MVRETLRYEGVSSLRVFVLTKYASYGMAGDELLCSKELTCQFGTSFFMYYYNPVI